MTEIDAAGTATLMLAPKLDLRGAAPLRDEIAAHVGRDLVLDASAVTHFGALALQVIRAAARSWGEAGHNLTMRNVSTGLADQLDLLGHSPQSLTDWEQPT